MTAGRYALHEPELASTTSEGLAVRLRVRIGKRPVEVPNESHSTTKPDSAWRSGHDPASFVIKIGVPLSDVEAERLPRGLGKGVRALREEFAGPGHSPAVC